jgi:hypothetical protein
MLLAFATKPEFVVFFPYFDASYLAGAYCVESWSMAWSNLTSYLRGAVHYNKNI